MKELKDIDLDDLDFYKWLVNTLAERKINVKFPNSSPVHAAIVLSRIFDNSESVLIYDSSLDGDIAYKEDDFLSSLDKFLIDGKKTLKIVTRKPIKSASSSSDDAKQKLFDYIRAHHPDNERIEIKTVSDEFEEATLKIAQEFDYEDVNFTVGDNCSYRLEQFKTETRYTADCNFNDTEKAGILLEVFNQHFESCNPVHF